MSENITIEQEIPQFLPMMGQKGTISPIEAKNLIYINTLGLDRILLLGLDISFKGHLVITYHLRKKI
jgi:hypothetical protein